MTYYQALGDGRWQIDPKQPSDFRRVILEALRDQPAPYRGAIYLWGLDTAGVMTATTLRADQLFMLGGGLHLAQALAEQVDANPAALTGARLWLVTRGAQPVGPASPLLAVAQSSLWGLGRAIALERAELGCTCVDLDPSDGAQNVQTLLDETRTPGTENQVAYRGHQRYVARLARRAFTPDAPPLAIRADGNYLITGGLGGLGLKIAASLIERGARHLVLMGRSDPSAAARQAVADLEQRGARVILVKGDVSNKQDVASVLTDMEPAVCGLIHAAGVLEDGALSQQSWEHLAKVLEPKLVGAWHLHTLTQHIPLDFFVLFSAGAALLGSPGQANYAAANAFLDGLAHYRRALGLPALSINWGAWSGVGMAARLERRLQDNGLGVIAPEQGVRIFEYLLRQSVAQIAVLPIDWHKLARQFAATGIPPLLSDLVRAAAPTAQAATTSLQRGLSTALEIRPG